MRLINNLRPEKRAGFLGIDLTSAEAKPSACLGLDRELCSEPEEGAICLPFLDRVVQAD